MKKTSARAVSKPLKISEERVRGKLAECEFFLQRMKGAIDVPEFGYYLSAFLSALSTFTCLALMHKQPKNAEKARQQLKNSPNEIGFLLRSRDVEIHRDGVRLWLLRPSGDPRTIPRFRGSLWGDLLLTARNASSSRYRSRFQPRFGDLRAALELTSRATAETSSHNFIFEDSGQDVIKACQSALNTSRLLAS